MNIYPLGHTSSCLNTDYGNLYFHDGGSSSKSTFTCKAACFGFVFSGQTQCTNADGQTTILNAGSFFNIHRLTEVSGGQVFILEVVDYTGIDRFGGPIEKSGRLCYIDGCTDTLLIPPLICGDPCLNALYFPIGINQTMHNHPSVRMGMVVRGSGYCYSDSYDQQLNLGDIFIIHPEENHAFKTTDEELVVIAFHPDSDCGPSDQDHPMLNRTYVNGVSAKHLDNIRTIHTMHTR